METFSIRLNTPAHDMAREEIRKQVAFLSRHISNVRFSDDGARMDFDAPPGDGARLQTDVQGLANRVERALRNLQRKIVYASPAAADPQFARDVRMDGVHFLGTGQVALSGTALRL